MNEPDAEADAALRGTVLLVEDDPTSRELFAGLLAGQPGVVLLQADGVDQGIRLAREAAPDLVLLDLHLGEGSGLEVVRALSEPLAAGRFDLILLTGDTLSMDVLKAMSLGAREYWAKPVRLPRVLAALARAVARRPLS